MLKANAASVPRSERVLGRANCLATDVVGDLVRIRAVKTGNLFEVERVDIATAGNPPAQAVIIRKLGATDCIVQFAGPIAGIYTGLTPNAAYFVGTDGRPAAAGDANFPSFGQPFQQIGTATDDEEVFLSFLGVASSGSGPSTTDRYNVLLTRIDDRTWLVPELFVSSTIRVYHNGRRLELASTITPVDGDYYVSESGGVGTGYDRVNLLRFSTNVCSKVRADYVAVI